MIFITKFIFLGGKRSIETMAGKKVKKFLKFCDFHIFLIFENKVKVQSNLELEYKCNLFLAQMFIETRN